jgi:hypothetical protein
MVLTECPSQLVVVFEQQLLNVPKVAWPYSAISCQQDRRVQPEFTLTIGSSDVNVCRLLSFI